MKNRKTQIIELTLKHIQEKGYLSFSYDDLAKELGVTKASIHYHYEKKGDLGIAVCDRLQEGLEKSLLEIEQAAMKLEDKPLEFILRRVKHIGHNGICPLSALQGDFNFLPNSMQERIQELSQMEIDFIVKLLDEAKKEGALHPSKNSHELAILLISSTKGALQYRRVLGDEFFSSVLEQMKTALKN
ncbi:TetR/AcrR family transcriptional regulator [Bacillus sp. 03113]|uniref:TetR/AcrR family transcriptional regulator n=1 Tax=Bacillus sp. 03113 TaxID=2578211 RepID=UPI001142FA74|nr:TetR/AcrR family transcriptional regulator [Bacillus sp. 03113]